MLTRLALSATTALAIALPAVAQEVKELSDVERAQFRAEVRAYLLDNPEVIMEAIDVLRAREAQEEAQQDLALVAQFRGQIFDDGFSYVGGNPEGDIIMVEFLDYRCGYCKKAHGDVAKLLETDGNIRFIQKELPILGEESVLAARFAVAVKQIAGDETYKNISNALMESRGAVNQAALRRLAETYGLDADKIEQQMQSEDVAKVLRDTRALAQNLKISGTPTFVLHDEMLRGYVPFDTLVEYVEAKRG